MLASASLLAALLALVACRSPARAQDASTLKKDMIGQWELSTTERSKTCVVTLKSDADAAGLQARTRAGCATALPFTKDITAWSVKGLATSCGCRMPPAKPVIDFTEVESRHFRRPAQGEGIYILQNLAAARSLAKSMDQMIGDWAMVRGNGQPICGLTLTNTEAGHGQFPGVPQAEMRSGGRRLRADAVAARARPDAADVGKRRDLAVRGRRQRAMAAGARQRRSADHAAAVEPGRSSGTGQIFCRCRCRSGRGPDRRSQIARLICAAGRPQLALNRSFPCASCISSPPRSR